MALFRFLKPSTKAGGTVGLSISAEGIAMTRVREDGESGPGLDFAEFRPVVEEAQRPAVLAEAVKDRGLNRSRCVCSLESNDYKLLQVEAPDVDPTELRAAVRWRIKDLIDFHVDDAVIDVFGVPNSTGRSGPRMMYAVVAHARTIQSVVDLVVDSGLKLEAIDIAEMALRNIAMLVPEQRGGVGMIAMGRADGLITISQEDTLYLARSLEYGSDQLGLNPDGIAEGVVLEMQRSLDYYESQLTGAPASQILVCPMADSSDAVLVERLSGQLGPSISPLTLGQLLDGVGELPPPLQARCLTAVGASLRRETRSL